MYHYLIHEIMIQTIEELRMKYSKLNDVSIYPDTSYHWVIEFNQWKIKNDPASCWQLLNIQSIHTFLSHIYDIVISFDYLGGLLMLPEKISDPPESRVKISPPARELTTPVPRPPRIIISKTLLARPSPRGPAGPAGRNPWPARLCDSMRILALKTCTYK